MTATATDLSQRRLVHDALLAALPQEAVAAHKCADCSPAAATASTKETPVTDTAAAAQAEAETQRRIEAALAAQRTEIDSFLSANNDAAAKAELIAELEAKLAAEATAKEQAVAAQLTAEKNYADLVALAEAHDAEVAEAKAAEARAETRAAEIKAIADEHKVVLYDEPTFAAKATVWAAETDDQFTATKAEITGFAKALAARAPAATAGLLAERTGAFSATAGAADAGGSGDGPALTGLKLLTGARQAGIDPSRASSIPTQG